jgi:sulfur-oxidizing protein SoxZ
VFRVKLAPGISANPYFEFFLTATRSGSVDFWWKDQDGTETTASAPLEVT